MPSADAEFVPLVSVMLERFFRQNAQPPLPVATREAFAARLQALIAERGLPPPLAPDDLGRPGGMSEAECAPLVARVVDDGAPALLADAARQLVKACFYPEFRVCRDSYREVAPDGACRRQQLTRVRGRISGTHCIDCPHWVALEPERHAAMLAHAWCAAAEELAAHHDVFLPEDFRALRRWLYRAARE